MATSCDAPGEIMTALGLITFVFITEMCCMFVKQHIKKNSSLCKYILVTSSSTTTTDSHLKTKQHCFCFFCFVFV